MSEQGAILPDGVRSLVDTPEQFFPASLRVGFLFSILYPAGSPSSSSSSSSGASSHKFVFVNHPLSHTHTSLSYAIFHTPTLSPTIPHTQLCYTSSFTHVTHHLSISHRLHIHLCQLPSLTHTHNFVTHHLSRESPFIQHLSYTTSTFVSRGRRGAQSHPPSFCVAGTAFVALGWLWWRAWAGFNRRDAAAL